MIKVFSMQQWAGRTSYALSALRPPARRLHAGQNGACLRRLLLAVMLLPCLLIGTRETKAQTSDAVSPAQDTSLSDLPAEMLEELFVFVAGNAFLTLHHEAAHMLVSELVLEPADGETVEDVVDALATIHTLSSPDDATSLLLTNALIGWYAGLETTGLANAFLASHGLDALRADRMLCRMAGANGVAFDGLALSLGFTEPQLTTCPGSFEQALGRWTRLVSTHLSAAPGDTGQISVRYGAAPPALEPVALFWRESQLMDLVAEGLSATYAFPAPVTFVARTCGNPADGNEQDASWDPENHQLTLCYELLSSYADLYRDSLAGN